MIELRGSTWDHTRGYAPLPIHLNETPPCILAVGAHLKNSVALSVGKEIFISQHIGDLETSEAFLAFRKTTEDLPRLYESKPEMIACDIHPIQNTKVLMHLRELGFPEEKATEWAAWINRDGLSACEKLIAREAGPFCFGDAPTVADLCLVPQLANARRFGVDVAAFPRLLNAEAAAKELKAFADAAPERQPDAE